MIPDSIAKKDVSYLFRYDIMHMDQKSHHYYTSPKGKISLVNFETEQTGNTPYQIYSWNKLFNGTEDYATVKEAEERIVELLT